MFLCSCAVLVNDKCKKKADLKPALSIVAICQTGLLNEACSALDISF